MYIRVIVLEQRALDDFLQYILVSSFGTTLTYIYLDANTRGDAK